ncbi:serine hydrolase domain-containing protein [Amycolatopsis acidicola]|uniref:serine hydrolase domain-containing protein n=1 Tax=Amycolatopsis acidicola TaxID=2596893 RepID=UPI001FB67345|nr:serine hydrolase domain-containing protein [Amycolatopsis acidicola]
MQGFVDDRFAPVGALFEESLNDGAGASVCVNVDGRTVLDLWGGFADAARTRPWQQNTIVDVHSVTKTMTALTALLLADRGEIDLAAPVSRYWPEFAANGKEHVTVAQVLSHSSGLSGWAEPIALADLCDWEKMTGLLAAQAPFWSPGTAGGYHVLTHGFLVGEVIRRVTGRTVGTVFREEIAEPLGADFHIGLPVEEDGRVADLIPPATDVQLFPDPTPLQTNAATNPRFDVAVTRTRAWRGAEIPAGNGIGNARSMTDALSVLACGGGGLLSESGCRRALEIQVEGEDLILGIPLRFGLGFAVSGGLMPNPNTLYWGGLGGSLVLVDLDARTTFAYAPSRMADTLADVRGLGLAMAMWEAMALL